MPTPDATSETTYDEAVTRAGRSWARGLRDQSGRPPDQAARASGARTPDEVATWIARCRKSSRP